MERKSKIAGLHRSSPKRPRFANEVTSGCAELHMYNSDGGQMPFDYRGRMPRTAGGKSTERLLPVATNQQSQHGVTLVRTIPMQIARANPVFSIIVAAVRENELMRAEDATSPTDQ
jgi:hypothetical protein